MKPTGQQDTRHCECLGLSGYLDLVRMSRGNNCHGESCRNSLLDYEKLGLQILYTTSYKIQSRSVTQSTCIQSLQRIAPGGITADIITLILPDLISANETKRDAKVADQSWAFLRISPQVFLETFKQANSDVQV